MNEATRQLLVLDETGALSRELLGRLDRIGSLLVSRRLDEARNRIEVGACQAVLIAVPDKAFEALSLALFVREVHPELPVMVLRGGFEPRLIRLANRTGLHLIVNDGDVEAVTTSVLERLPATVHP